MAKRSQQGQQPDGKRRRGRQAVTRPAMPAEDGIAADVIEELVDAVWDEVWDEVWWRLFD